MQKTTKRPKYIFIVGGVMSGVGKGVASASIGKILQLRGFSVTALKIDPYVNVDAGTMNPTEHGEVFVLDDGTECDQDMGNYERFLNKSFSGANYMTTGSIYRSVINRERNLGYGGILWDSFETPANDYLSNPNSLPITHQIKITVTSINDTPDITLESKSGTQILKQYVTSKE